MLDCKDGMKYLWEHLQSVSPGGATMLPDENSGVPKQIIDRTTFGDTILEIESTCNQHDDIVWRVVYLDRSQLSADALARCPNLWDRLQRYLFELNGEADSYIYFGGNSEVSGMRNCRAEERESLINQYYRARTAFFGFSRKLPKILLDISNNCSNNVSVLS